MIDPVLLEQSYNEYTSDLGYWGPDGIMTINIRLLKSLGLLRADNGLTKKSSMDQAFHIIETDEKITLINEKYVIWIVPDIVDDLPTTFALLARSDKPKPVLELVFSAAGIYNTSPMVLSVLERFIAEIEENNASLENITDES